jgi:hypothetical protein
MPSENPRPTVRLPGLMAATAAGARPRRSRPCASVLVCAKGVMKLRTLSITLALLPLLFALTGSTATKGNAETTANEAALNEIKLYFGLNLTGPDREPIDVAENRLRRDLERLGLMIRSSSPYQLHGQANVVDEERIDGGMAGTKYALAVELHLFLEDTRNGQILGSVSASSKGVAETRDGAINKAVKNLKFSEAELVGLRDRALDRVAALLDDECTRAYDEALGLYDQRRFREALLPLSRIVPSAGVYEKAQGLKKTINDALWRQEQDRIKEAQAKAKIEEEKRLQAFHKAQEADAYARARKDSLETVRERARVTADSLKLATERRQAKADDYRFRLQSQENEIRTLEEGLKRAEQEKELAHADLDKTLASHEQAVEDLDRLWEPTRPPAEDPDGDRSGWEPKKATAKASITGKWEFIKDESSVRKCPFEAETLELGFRGDVTVWVLGKDSEIVVGQGTFSVDDSNLTLNFQTGNAGRYVDQSYEVSMRGDSRMYLLDKEGNKFAFCKTST